MNTPRLDLLVLQVADLDAASRFYAALGLTFVRERHGAGPEHFSSSIGGVLLELYPATGGLTSHATRLGFSVPLLDLAVDALLAQGGTLVSAAKASPWGRRAVVADPDGHRVELREA